MTATTDPAAVSRRLYDAFAARDGQAIVELLADDFVGEVSDGMPLGVGGRHDGATAMLRDCWAPVFGAYEMHVEADEYLPTGDDRVVVIGRYRGTRRDDGCAVDASFAHVLTIRGDRIAGLRQITDTVRWREPAAGLRQSTDTARRQEPAAGATAAPTAAEATA